VVGGAFRLDRCPLALLQEQMTAGVSMGVIVEDMEGTAEGMAEGLEGMEDIVKGMAEDTEEDMAEGMAAVIMEGMAAVIMEGMAAVIMEGTEGMVEAIMEIGTRHQRPRSSIGEGVAGRWLGVSLYMLSY